MAKKKSTTKKAPVPHTAPKVPFCRDCIHRTATRMPTSHQRCAVMPLDPEGLVTGNPTLTLTCLEARADQNRCGESGAYFEPRPGAAAVRRLALPLLIGMLLAGPAAADDLAIRELTARRTATDSETLMVVQQPRWRPGEAASRGRVPAVQQYSVWDAIRDFLEAESIDVALRLGEDGAIDYTDGNVLRADGDSFETGRLGTDDVDEETNLYYTQARADARVQAAINDAGQATDELWSSDKIATEVAGAGASELADLSDVTGTTGSGSTVVLADSPTLTTPIVGDFTSATHDHADGAGGGQLNPASALSGAVPVHKGGTNRTTITSHTVLVGNAASTVALVGPGASGEVLKGNTGSAPSFGAVDVTSDITGTVPTANLGTGTANSSTFLRGDQSWAAPTASLGDGDYGDITVGGSGTTMTIDADAVTYGKMQDTSGTNVVLGRSTAGAGTVEEIACTSAGRALLDDADASAQRTTLELGSAAVEDTSAFATAAQGSTADSAMQDLSDDTSPTLGGDLDGDGNEINNALIGESTRSSGKFTNFGGSSGALSLSTSGTNDDVSLGTASVVVSSAAGTVTITGFAGGYDGRVLFVVNNSFFAMTINNQDGSSSAANRVATGTGGAVSTAGIGTFMFVYSTVNSRWNLVGNIS
jgi:hypothetical protein